MAYRHWHLMINPFRVCWLEGWTFQTVLLGGRPVIEAYGFGVCLKTEILIGESPRDAADRLVLAEDRLRHSLHNAWKRGPQQLLQTVIDGEQGEEVVLQADLLRRSQQLLPSLTPRQEVMQGLGH